MHVSGGGKANNTFRLLIDIDATADNISGGFVLLLLSNPCDSVGIHYAKATVKLRP